MGRGKGISKKERGFILENHKTMTAIQMAAALKRDPVTIYNVCNQFEIAPKRLESRGRPKIILTEEQQKFISDNASTLTVTQIAKAVMLSRNTVLNYCAENNISLKKRPADPGAPKEIIRFDPKPIQRPKAVYTNTPTPYGIADELHHNPNSFIHS